MPLPSVAISVTSTPVWNARPAPVCTITRTSGSASSARHAGSNSSRIKAFIAFSWSGRLLINQPTGPLRSRLNVSSLGYSTSSAPRNFPPARTLPRIGLTRQTEHPLTDDVLVDLGRATLDRVRPASQHPAHLERLICRPGHRTRAQQVGREELDALVQLPRVHLAHRAFGPG